MPRIVDVDQRRMELAAAAARVIARAGVDGASMREIANEAGWTTGTLVHYFANKHELLDFTLRASIAFVGVVVMGADGEKILQRRRAVIRLDISCSTWMCFMRHGGASLWSSRRWPTRCTCPSYESVETRRREGLD